MSILKLSEAGQSATLEITGCELVEGQYGEQVKFVAGEDILFLPRASADRQLERIGFVGIASEEYDGIVGQTLEFSRTASSKPGAKPFWNINPVKKAAPVKVPSNKVPAPSHSNVPNKDLPEFLQDAETEDAAELSKKVGFDVSSIQKELALYQALAEFVVRDIAPIYEKGKVGMSPESAAASVQTLFINLTGGKKP